MHRGRTSEDMTHIQDPDDVVGRLQLLDPRRGVRYELHDVDGRLARIVSAGDSLRAIGADDEEVPHGKRTVRRSRWRYATIGALVGTGALAAALVLSAGTGSPKNPRSVRSALPPPVLKIQTKLFGYGDAEAPTYDFTSGSNLSQSSGTGIAYALSAPTDVSSVAEAIATALGLHGGVTPLGGGGYDAGAAPGPFATIVNSGFLSWTYPNWGGNVNENPSLGAPQSIPVNPNAPLPTDGQATADALRLLNSMGANTTELGGAQVSRASAAVDLAFRVEVGGLATDQWDSVSYGPGSVVIYTGGVILSATPSATYPTVSAAAAACLLPSDGYTSSNGYVPSSGGSSCNTGATGSDVVNVTINSAVPELSTQVLANGRTWLLPTWGLSGPQSGSFEAAGSTYRGSVVSIPSQFLQIARSDKSRPSI
jgi:hypothetical protein